MGKIKKNKINADDIVSKKSNKSKKINPFEVQVNKEKFNVLGRVSKDSRGRPGMSRGKAVQKRKSTLGKEFLNQHKSNQFRDKRIGGYGESKDDVLTARFTAEKFSQYQSKRKALFNLNDEEMLTHKGQTLEEIEQFQDIDVSDDDSEDEGKLNADFTEMAHFGGGEDEDKNVNRKTAIEEMILESKKRKIEKVKEKEEVEQMTNVLDDKWKSLIPVMGQLTARNQERPKPDEYDKMMREMVFEPRGEVTDRLLSADDLAKKERVKLEELEKERIDRMQGDDDKPKFVHRSADELDDGYFLNPAPKQQTKILAYDLNGDSSMALNDNVIQLNIEDNKSSLENVNNASNYKQLLSSEGQIKDNCQESDDSENGEDESLDGTEFEDDLDDFKNIEEDDDEDDSNEISNNNTTTKLIQVKLSNSTKKLNEIPYTFEVPKKYDDFLKLINKYNVEEIIIIERLIKSNHPKTSQEGKEKMTIILTYLLQYVSDKFSDMREEDVADNFKFLNKLSPMIFMIAQLIPLKTTKLFKEIIKEKHEEFSKKEKQCPGVETLVYLKLVSLIFPTSDYRHEVVTPSLIFLSKILTKIRIKTRSDISRGLFLATLCLEYSNVSKRFLPAALNFILGTIQLCIKKRAISILKAIPPFKSKGPLGSLLVMDAYDDDKDIPKNIKEINFLNGKDLILHDIDSDFKIRSLNLAINLTNDYFQNLSSYSGVQYFATNFLSNIEKLPAEIYPNVLQRNINGIIEYLTQLENKTFTYLVTEKRRPKPLRLIEPKFEKVYDGRKKFNEIPNERDEQQKLKHKIKRETKGAIREIRRDNEFLAKVQLKRQMQSDKERREKVKRIYAEASIQQGELNALDRNNSKKKK